MHNLGDNYMMFKHPLVLIMQIMFTDFSPCSPLPRFGRFLELKILRWFNWNESETNSKVEYLNSILKLEKLWIIHSVTLNKFWWSSAANCWRWKWTERKKTMAVIQRFSLVSDSSLNLPAIWNHPDFVLQSAISPSKIWFHIWNWCHIHLFACRLRS